jgi:hypothetical protein
MSPARAEKVGINCAVASAARLAANPGTLFGPNA